MCASEDASSSNTASELLANPRFDLIPFEGFNAALSHLPPAADIAITLAPELGVERTVERAEEAASHGYSVLPHIAPRFIHDESELEDIAVRLHTAGVTAIFVPGGDRAEPIGDYRSAYEMLVALEDLGQEFAEVGITGYPEGHHEIPDDVIWNETRKKMPFADFFVTQMCFDPIRIIDWVRTTRSKGFDIPVEVGIPGVVTYTRLMKMAWRYGIARPIQFVQKTTGLRGFLTELILARGKYRPDELIETLVSSGADVSHAIGQLRLYTFNETAQTESWRLGQLEGHSSIR